MIEIAVPVRAWLEARVEAVDVRALAAQGAAFAQDRTAALGRGAVSRLHAFCAVAVPMLGMFEREMRASLLRVVAYGCALAAMTAMVAEVVTRSSHAIVAEVSGSEWVEVNRPLAAFALTLPDFEQARHASWRHADGGGRKDILTFGDLGSSGATAVIELYRAGSEPNPSDDIVTASIGELRLSAGPALPATIETKFGEVAVEPFTDRTGAGKRQCLKFARAFEETNFELSGWFCNAGEELVDRGKIACALDRLTLVAAASEPRLSALFARAELKRTFCGQQSVFLAATPKRNDWIEAARDPRLRGRN